MDNQLLIFFRNLMFIKNKYFSQQFAPPDNLKKIHSILFFLLKNFNSICTELPINYFLVAGTLLGAVRHKGFIPWDDDVDIGLLKKDIINLKEILKNNRDFTIKEYFHFHKDHIQFYHSYKFSFRNFNDTVFLDLFPLYIVDENVNFTKLRDSYNKLLLSFLLDHNYDIDKFYTFYDNSDIFYKLLKIENKFLENFENFNRETSKFIMWGFENVWIFNKLLLFNNFYPLKYHIFIDQYFPIPNKFHEILTLQYGDYSIMQKDSSKHHLIINDVFNLQLDSIINSFNIDNLYS